MLREREAHSAPAVGPEQQEENQKLHIKPAHQGENRRASYPRMNSRFLQASKSVSLVVVAVETVTSLACLAPHWRSHLFCHSPGFKELQLSVILRSDVLLKNKVPWGPDNKKQSYIMDLALACHRPRVENSPKDQSWRSESQSGPYQEGQVTEDLAWPVRTTVMGIPTF